MVKYSTKGSRHIKHRHINIHEEIHEILNDECYDGDFHEDENIMDDSKNIEKKTYSLTDFMKAGLLTKQPSKKGRQKSRKIPKCLKEDRGGATKIHQNEEREKVVKRVCNGGNGRKEENRNILLDLQSKSFWLHLSRVGKGLHGSTKVFCHELKIVFLLIWNVHEYSFDFHIIPIINCSTLTNSSIHIICKNISKNMQMQFESQLNTQNKLSPQSDQEMFYEISSIIVNSENDISLQLSQELRSLSGLEKNLSARLEKILQKSTSVHVECSLDYFDVFAQSNIDCEQLENMSENKKSSDERFCSICFDSFEDNKVHLRTCGHTFCDSCWKGHVRASSSSGDVVINCPAYKCNEVLNMRDISHLLFDKAEDNTIQDISVLMNLMTFKMDQTLRDKKFIHCSTPSCNRVFSHSPFLTKDENNSSTKCMEVCLCRCGASRCLNCKEPAHFGISCIAAKRIKKEVESGRLDNEMRSLRWLQKFCTPCPKCNFPINKNGGCNHVLCGNCQYYFCWICGGDGHKCGSYLCRQTGTATFGKKETPGYDSEKSMMANQILSIRQYSDAMTDLDHCVKSIATAADETALQRDHELQLRKNLTWLRGYLLDKSLSLSNEKKRNHAMDVATKVEVTLGFLTDTFGTDKMNEVLKDEENITRPAKRNYNYKKKQVSKPLRNEMKNHCDADEKEISLTKIIQAKNIETLNDRQFNAHISKVLTESMQQLVNTGRNRKKFVDEKETYELQLLNQRKKELKAPWKGESRFDAPKIFVRDVSMNLQDKLKIKSVNRLKWKGKSKVNARRHHALQSNQLEIAI